MNWILVGIELLSLLGFIPYKIDRPPRRVPYVTYGLIAINTFVFLATVLVSNVNLEADKIAAQAEYKRIVTALESNPGSSLDAAHTAEQIKKLLPDATTPDGYKKRW